MRLQHTPLRRVSRALQLIPLVALTILGAACNSSNTDTGLSNAFTLKTRTSTDSIVVTKGGSTSVPLTATRGGGYIDAVTFGVDTTHTGITTAFAPQALGTGATASVLTISADFTAVEGPDSLTLLSSGFNVATDSLKIRFTVVAPALTVTVGATTASASIGGAASIPITVQRLNGFGGAITLTAEGVPDNVTATFTPALIPNGATNSTLTLTPLASAAVSTNTITVRAKSTTSGPIEKTSPFAFSIVANGATNFSPSASPASLALAAGATTQSVISLNRTGAFVSAVSFAVTGLPAGASATVTPNPTTANSATLSIATTTATLPGIYNLVLTGSATGLASRTIPLVLTVNVPQAVAVSLLSPMLTVAKGSSGQTGLTVTRLGGLLGDIVLSADALPNGVTGSFSPVTITGTGTTGIVTLAVSTTAVSGTYAIVIRGTNNATTIAGATTLTLVVP